MCGILCCIYHENKINTSTNTGYDTNQWNLLEDNIAKRGPDSLTKHSQKLNDEWSGEFIGSVLWMQGPSLVSQPCIDDEGNILLWNGDIFSGRLISHNNCDTLTLLMRLKSSKNIVETIDLIEGPFSIIYFQKSTNLLYFARDKIGRHSLLVKVNKKNESITLCSVANENIDNIIELPALGIFVLNLQSSIIDLLFYPWQKLHEQSMASLNKFEKQFELNITSIIILTTKSKLFSYLNHYVIIELIK